MMHSRHDDHGCASLLFRALHAASQRLFCKPQRVLQHVQLDFVSALGGVPTAPTSSLQVEGRDLHRRLGSKDSAYHGRLVLSTDHWDDLYISCFAICLAGVFFFIALYYYYYFAHRGIQYIIRRRLVRPELLLIPRIELI